MNRKSGAVRSLSAQGFTEKQGQYLAFIYTYSHMFRRPPAETDMQRHFQVSPPSVHQMIVTLERNGFIRRQPGVARSIQILVAPQDLPILDWLQINPSKSLCPRVLVDRDLPGELVHEKHRSGPRRPHRRHVGYVLNSGYIAASQDPRKQPWRPRLPPRAKANRTGIRRSSTTGWRAITIVWVRRGVAVTATLGATPTAIAARDRDDTDRIRGRRLNVCSA